MWTSRSYINYEVQCLPVRNGSYLAIHSWNVLCCNQCPKTASLPGQQYSFIIHWVYSDPLSLLHYSKVITLSSITIQHRRTQIQSIPTSLQRKLWRAITWRSLSFLFTIQHLLSAAISPYKDLCRNESMLTDMHVIYLNKKQFQRSKL